MDLSNYSKEELFLSAIKSEVESNDVYSKLADSVKNAFLKDKLKFLASEEAKHRQLLETGYKNEFPAKEISLPDKTYVPLPELLIPDEAVPVSEVLEAAMTAEQAAQEFYSAFSEQYPDDSDMKKTLLYFANMELGHYKILEVEKENMLKYEAYDEYWPMMHIGT
ncbi:ferritin family protein [Candidatus Pacearchaeota archaeon]|nr:ferritin family protein [Candidatus Pacearchaeota archaeon]